MSSKSDGADPIVLAKNQAQLKAEQSLAQNKGVDFSKSGILSNNSSNGEQKHTIVRGKMPQREPIDDNLFSHAKKNKVTGMFQSDRYVPYPLVQKSLKRG